jgi:hypothetical protein
MIRRFLDWMFAWPDWVPFKVRAFFNSYANCRNCGVGIVPSLRTGWVAWQAERSKP